MEEKKNDSKIEEKHLEKVTSGSIRTKKKSKFQELFIQEDIKSAALYAFEELMVPGIRNIFVDTLISTVKRMFLGESEHRRSSDRLSSRISYHRYYDDRDDRDYYKRRKERDERDRYGFKEILFAEREDADDVLEKLFELMGSGYIVSVADYYDLCGEIGSHTDNKYGWTDLRSARVERYGREYYIKLPPAVPL